MQNMIMDLAHINEMYSASLKELMNYALEAGVWATSSTVGYIAFVTPDQQTLNMFAWSNTAMEMCKIEDKPYVYSMATVGLWGDPVRQRKPIITNDYQRSDRRQGYPSGHVEITRHMSVPIFEYPAMEEPDLFHPGADRKVVMLAGVGNKVEPYNDFDVTSLTLLMDGVWRHLRRKKCHEELEKIVRSRTADLEEMNRQLRRSNEELAQFAYAASHDLKTPIRAIYNLASWVEEDYQAGKDVMGHIKMILPRVKRMDDLINGLLEYSRIGRETPELSLIDADDVLVDVLEDLSFVGHVRTTVSLPKILCNKIMLYRIFSNLINNAIKHHQDPPHAMVEISAEERGDRWVFCVSDDGPGIEEKDYEKIFQMFQTLKPKEDTGSTGIGLPIVKRMIEVLGGKIWVESIVGKGTKFFFDMGK